MRKLAESLDCSHQSRKMKPWFNPCLISCRMMKPTSLWRSGDFVRLLWVRGVRVHCNIFSKMLESMTNGHELASSFVPWNQSTWWACWVNASGKSSNYTSVLNRPSKLPWIKRITVPSRTLGCSLLSYDELEGLRKYILPLKPEEHVLQTFCAN